MLSGAKYIKVAEIIGSMLAVFAVVSLRFLRLHDFRTNTDSPLKWTQMFARVKRPPTIQRKGWFLRKLTARQKLRHFRRARRQMKRHVVRIPGKLSILRAAAKERFDAAKRALPPALVLYDQRPGCCVLRPPSNFDLVDNYEDTLAFLMEIRGRSATLPVIHPETGSKLSLFTDFSALRTIAPGAGLVLAAELDRRRLVTGVKPHSLDAEWDPSVRTYFHQAGLFELLGIEPQVPEDEEPIGALQAVRFVRGRSVRGEIGSKLRDKVEALCGQRIGPRTTVYEAISEAIANTRHAYPRHIGIWPTKATGQWWAAGTWNSDTNVVSLQLYDQGVGIPATLPKSEHWSDVLSKLGGNLLHPERSADRLIAAALEVGRTSTGEKGRGKGLAEMTAWIDKLGNGFLRITSERGTVSYRAGGVVSGVTRKAPFFGTLIEWEIGLRD